MAGCVSSSVSGYSAIVVGRLLKVTKNNDTLLFFVGASADALANWPATPCPKCRPDLMGSRAPAE